MPERNDFIRDIIDADLAAGRHQRVATRFPPEPNGYLHVGHAKSIALNFGLALDYQGTCNLRYDDTNPTREDVEYVEAIEKDIRWLGFEPTQVLFSADYFPKMYELAERLVREGKAYVCDLTDEQIREYRGTLSEPGRPSPNRDRNVDDNLALLRKMKAGELPDGACTLRAKIDMASANMKMRDPLLYRIRHAHHHRSGDAWKIYPMYDWAHPIEDAIEGITHSICTLEFENNRELYDWVLDNTGPWDPRPHQYEFARLELDYTVMSKRKLRALVEENLVRGWDDPRMPTIAGMRRRGYSPAALRNFAHMVGVAKANSVVDFGKLEYCLRDDLNHNAPRVLGVLHPIEVELTGWDGTSESTDAPYFPADVGKPGSRALAFNGSIYIDRDDWRDDPPAGYHRLAPGRTVRLRYGYCITADEVTERDASGNATKLRATLHGETKGGKNPADGRKVHGVIHWVDKATSIPAEIRLYDHLFKATRPEDGGADFHDQLSDSSLEVVTTARLEASLAGVERGSRWQLERIGYFVVDDDSTSGAIVMNRIVTLRTEVAKPAAVVPDEPKEHKQNKKAATRPKSKSPAEYRAEARVRDPELAESFAKIAAVTDDTQADLLAGETVTAQLFLDTVAAGGAADVTAKWMINELPRALADKTLADANLDAKRFAELIVAIGQGSLMAGAGKSALAEMIATGKSLSELGPTETISAGELGAKVDAIIAANPDKAAQYKAGKTGLLGFFVGQVMKATPNADAAAVNAALRERLS